MHTAEPTHLNVFTVQEYDAPTKEEPGKKARSWTKVGIAFPHKEGPGFNIQLKALPVNGQLVALPADEPETEEPAPRAQPAAAPRRR
jgi:hypothetical protein